MSVKTLQFKAPATEIGKSAGLQSPFMVVASGSGKSRHVVLHSVSGLGKTVHVCFDPQASIAKKLRRYMVKRAISHASIRSFLKRHPQSTNPLTVYWATCKKCPIPPLSVVKLVSADEDHPIWRSQIGKTFRVGYYNRNDGLKTIWLVDRNGQYCQTTDLASLRKHFKIVGLAPARDLFGDNRPPIRPLVAAAQSVSSFRHRIPA